MSTTIVWFRDDYRLGDHPALYHAIKRGQIIPVAIYHPPMYGEWPWGGASRWWQQTSLARFAERLASRGIPLVTRVGDPKNVLQEIAHATGADYVYWNRSYLPSLDQFDIELQEVLASAGVGSEVFPGKLLHEPDQITTGAGGLYRVFTPYWRAKLLLPIEQPLPTVDVHAGHAAEHELPTTPMDVLTGATKTAWTDKLAQHWSPGEEAAQEVLHVFSTSVIDTYAIDRDRPDRDGTSSLSPYLAQGDISARQIWHNIMRHVGEIGTKAEPFLRQLAWRDFSYQLLVAMPDLTNAPMRNEFSLFPWEDDGDMLRKWQTGKTGYPMVDAAMRQLWQTGWMHNRARMIVASFLTKHLLTNWTWGAAWFWDTLVDADLANNTFGWQWSAGCGADAQPYFRIFNPMSQGTKFDPEGRYVCRWLGPAFDALSTKFRHAPFNAPDATSQYWYGRHDYPKPIIDHVEARERALGAFAAIRGAQG